jgi:CreA protein
MNTYKLHAIALILVSGLFGCDKSEVGDISLGVFTTQDIKLNTLVDPLVPGVTCHVASIEADLSFADPSDSSIACRQTGEITAAMIATIDKSKSGEIVFRKSKSIFFKTMKIRRVFDAESQTLMYVSYSTKETSGSFKHSLSTVPLWGTQAYVNPVGIEQPPSR